VSRKEEFQESVLERARRAKRKNLKTSEKTRDDLECSFSSSTSTSDVPPQSKLQKAREARFLARRECGSESFHETSEALDSLRDSSSFMDSLSPAPKLRSDGDRQSSLTMSNTGMKRDASLPAAPSLAAAIRRTSSLAYYRSREGGFFQSKV